LVSVGELPVFVGIQINMRAGQLPEAEENEISYLKLPLNYFHA